MKEHPDWDIVEVYTRARKEFNISALTFFAETLKTLSNLRPKVLQDNFEYSCLLINSIYRPNGDSMGYQ